MQLCINYCEILPNTKHFHLSLKGNANYMKKHVLIVWKEPQPGSTVRNTHKNFNFCDIFKTWYLDFALIDELSTKNRKKGRRKRMFNLQEVQVHHSLHPSHLSQEPQVVQESHPQMGVLEALAVPGGQEVLEAPYKTRRHISVTQRGMF